MIKILAVIEESETDVIHANISSNNVVILIFWHKKRPTEVSLKYSENCLFKHFLNLIKE